MEKKTRFLSAGILSAAVCLALLAGCSDFVLSEKDSPESQSDGLFGSLTVVPSAQNRALDISEITYADITVSGTGIAHGKEPSALRVPVAGGKGGLSVQNIPVGKNRIVTVQAFSNSDGAKIDGVRIRAVTDIVSGDNSIPVTWETTALGNVFASLHESGVDVSKISDSDKNRIQGAIDPTKHASLINASAIASDYKNGSLKGAASYVLAPAKLTFSYTALSSYKVQITDPASSVQACTSGRQTVSGIAPGTWNVYILDSDGTVTVRKPVNMFASGETLNLENLDPVPMTDIIVHAKIPYIYIWDSGTSADKVEFTSMNDEGNGWYGIKIEAASAKMIFMSAANWDSKASGDLSREAGEWWFKDGTWYDSNPEKPSSPVVKASVAAGTYLEAQTVTLSSSNASGDVIYYTTDGTEPTASSAKYTSPISVSSSLTLKARGYNPGAVPQWGSVYEFRYIIDPNADIEPPVIVPSKEAGRYKEDISVSFTITDNKANGFTVYYTNDGTVPTDSSPVYARAANGTLSTTGTSFPVSVGKNMTVKLLAVDAAGNKTERSFFYRVSDGTESTDFREETIYFLMTTRFYDGDSSNNEYCWDEGGEYLAFGEGDCAWRGDFKGLAEKLDYIKALGFSAIWITPVVENASGIDYHGYHAYDFSKVDPRYESTGFTYQDLINTCHEKGIKIIQDIVLNHTGNFGERNLFHMFDKENTPYINKDVPTPAGGKRSPFMKLAADGGYGYEALQKALGGKDYESQIGSIQYGARINAMKEDSNDSQFIYHHCKTIDWNSENCQLGQMAGDCVDLNTENPAVAKYLRDCYVNYINMGVDGFRIDTVKHISRLTFNNEFIPAFMEAGGENFFIFGETCARYRGRWNEGVPALSPSFYTWKENSTFAWSSSDHAVNSASASSHFATYKSSFEHPAWKDGIANHLLKGNEYHTPDYSMRSYLDQIDFPMHWAFKEAGDAFNTAVNTNDPDFNDATWNVVYVDSHDYAPDCAPENQRFAGEWPDKLNLMFTFRGIPCIYYGSEIEFKKGLPIDPANVKTSCEKSGRAYFGDHIEGTVTASDYGVYEASGAVKETLDHELSQHIIRLNKIRRSIPALQKGQYSTEGCKGGIAFKRRYTDDSVDSFAVVTINGGAEFSGIPGGTYIEVVTGKPVTIPEGGTITTDSIGNGNMRVYVNTSLKGCEVSGKIGTDGAYLK